MAIVKYADRSSKWHSLLFFSMMKSIFLHIPNFDCPFGVFCLFYHERFQQTIEITEIKLKWVLRVTMGGRKVVVWWNKRKCNESRDLFLEAILVKPLALIDMLSFTIEHVFQLLKVFFFLLKNDLLLLLLI